LCLSILIGKSLSNMRLAICTRGRHLMERHELKATLVAWLFVFGASAMMLAGLFSINRTLYVVGCVALWGTVPVTCIWKYRELMLRRSFLILTMAYFASAIMCNVGIVEEIRLLNISPCWHWLIAMYILVAANLACTSAAEQRG
jgi:hypothetical protein